ncbi:MAG: hypothetical protein ABW134_11755 [Candidatus Thiodiazotropha endolucinida]
MHSSITDPTFLVPELNVEEHVALKAVVNGEGNEYQQKLAMKVIVDKFSMANDLLYIPDSFDKTAFINGRAFVGNKIKLYLKKPASKKEPANVSKTE